MKKLITYTLTGLLFLSTTSGFAQTKKETIQQKLLRLQTENEVLKRENDSLQKQVASLQKITQNLPSKPYYLTKQAEKICEKYPACKKEAEQEYKENPLFQITSIDTMECDQLYFPWQKRTIKTFTRLTAHYRSDPRYFFSIPVALDGKPIQ